MLEPRKVRVSGGTGYAFRQEGVGSVPLEARVRVGVWPGIELQARTNKLASWGADVKVAMGQWDTYSGALLAGWQIAQGPQTFENEGDFTTYEMQTGHLTLLGGRDFGAFELVLAPTAHAGVREPGPGRTHYSKRAAWVGIGGSVGTRARVAKAVSLGLELGYLYSAVGPPPIDSRVPSNANTVYTRGDHHLQLALSFSVGSHTGRATLR